MKTPRPIVTRFLVAAALCAAPALSACSKSQPASSPEAKPVMAHAAAPTPVKAGAAPVAFDAPPPVGTKARCAVAGEEFTVAANTEMVKHEGKHYAFCCADCKPTFEKNPAKYAVK